MIWLILAGLVGAGALVAFVRLAPSDPARWHVAIAADGAADCTVQPAPDSARLSCLMTGTPGEVLAKLDAVAQATPRTQVLAGTPNEGRITWTTRTKVWGFPDYTTAEAKVVDGQTRLDLFARQRIGRYDWGVNAARLADWKAQLGL